MVEGLPGPNFAGVKQYSLNTKAWGEAPVPCGAGASLRVLRVDLLSGAYCLRRIVQGVFFMF